MPLDLTRDNLLKHFRYENGKLFWVARGNGKFDKQFAGKEAGCIAKYGYRLLSFMDNRVLAHKIIWIMHYGDIPAGMEIDHINNDGLDNRIDNLRLCTSRENKLNTGLRRDNSSGIKGVNWNKATNKWRAKIKHNGKTMEVGSFENLLDAANAISSARNKYHGAFANHGRMEAAQCH